MFKRLLILRTLTEDDAGEDFGHVEQQNVVLMECFRVVHVYVKVSWLIDKLCCYVWDEKIEQAFGLTKAEIWVPGKQTGLANRAKEASGDQSGSARSRKRYR